MQGFVFIAFVISIYDDIKFVYFIRDLAAKIAKGKSLPPNFSCGRIPFKIKASYRSNINIARTSDMKPYS